MAVLVEEKTKKSKHLLMSHKKMRAKGIKVLFLWTCVTQFVTVRRFRGTRLREKSPSCTSLPLKYTGDEAKIRSRFCLKFLCLLSSLPLMVSRFKCNIIGFLLAFAMHICDMVAVARYMNITLIVPELDKTSFWADQSEFKDIFGVDNFISSLRSEVRILKELPPRLKFKVESRMLYELPPISWSNISYYHQKILPLLRKHKVEQNRCTSCQYNGLPIEIQKLRCKVNFNSLRFTP